MAGMWTNKLWLRSKRLNQVLMVVDGRCCWLMTWICLLWTIRFDCGDWWLMLFYVELVEQGASLIWLCYLWDIEQGTGLNQENMTGAPCLVRFVGVGIKSNGKDDIVAIVHILSVVNSFKQQTCFTTFQLFLETWPLNRCMSGLN